MLSVEDCWISDQYLTGFQIIILNSSEGLQKSMVNLQNMQYFSTLYAPHFYPTFQDIFPCFFYMQEPQTQLINAVIPIQTVTECTPESSSLLTNHIIQLPKKSVVSLEKKQKSKKSKKDEGTQPEKESFVQKRNIIPNNVNHILSFVQRKTKSLLLVEKIISKLDGEMEGYNAKRFYAYQALVKGKLSVHVSKYSLEALLDHFDPCDPIFPTQEQAFYNKVCRIVVTHYLRTIAPLVTLHSRRLIQTNKVDHLKTQRNLQKHIQRVLRTSQTSF